MISLNDIIQKINIEVMNVFVLLNEETSEIFSYLSSPVESGCDNRLYLVKWLNLIHNLLVCSFKIAKKSWHLTKLY